MENKTEISCPNCNQMLRIPVGKHIKFICPNCSNELEIDGRVKEAKKKSSYTWIYTSILSGLLVFGYKYYTNKNDKKLDSNPNIITESANSKKENANNNSNSAVYDNNLNELRKAVDISNPTTNDFAVRLASKFPGEYNIGQICQIYDYIVRNWKYVNDSDKLDG